MNQTARIQYPDLYRAEGAFLEGNRCISKFGVPEAMRWMQDHVKRLIARILAAHEQGSHVEIQLCGVLALLVKGRAGGNSSFWKAINDLLEGFSKHLEAFPHIVRATSDLPPKS